MNVACKIKMSSVYADCFQSQGCDVVYAKRDLYQRLWINKKRPIPEVVDE